MRDHARAVEIEAQHLMGADAPPGESGRHLFETLAAHGKITMPFQETFWARGLGMCVDRFAVPWMINCEKPLALGTSARTESRAAAASA